MVARNWRPMIRGRQLAGARPDQLPITENRRGNKGWGAAASFGG
jgi:hypothetical protein